MGAASDVARRRALSAGGIFEQWAGVLAGPIAFAIDLTVSYSRVKFTCGRPQIWYLHGFTVLALAIIACGAWAAWKTYILTPDEVPTDGDSPVARSRFMAVLGLTSCAFFTLVVIAMAIPRWMQSSVCQ